MKKTYYLVLITLSQLMTGCLTIQAQKVKPLDLRTMTFNIRNGRAKDGENRWELRKKLVCDVIRDYAPDVLGVQEAFRFQLDEFNKSLPEYGEVGIGRDGGSKGEHSSILYLQRRFDVDESGTFWLSDTPTKPSAHWGNSHRRVCTWARLIDKESTRSVYVYNTHLDHQSQRARENGVQLIMKTIKERTHPDPFILMGDFNSHESNPVVAYLKGTGKLAGHSSVPVVDSWRVLHPEEKVAGTFSRFTGYQDGPKIDHIFVTPDTRTLEATIVRTKRDGRYPSDHYPVTARLRFEENVSARGEREAKVNIVLIMADDLGFADIGCYGSEIRTPNLDALAAKGLRFSQFYNTAKCHSSRVSLLTGLYCDQAGGAGLSRGATIAEVLGKAGYTTSMVGKWHLNRQPTDFGFQRYWGHLSGACNFFTGDDTFRFNAEKFTVPKRLNGRPFYTTHAMGDFALKFLDEATAKKDPFLLYVAFNAPHYPLQAPEADVKKCAGRYDGGWDQLRATRYAKQLKSGLIPKKFALSKRPAHIPAWDSLSARDRAWEASRMEVFAAMVEVMDQNIGRIIAKLKAKGAWENTLFLFCADNGACPFERTRGRNLKPWDPKSYWTYDASWAHAGNTPFRLYKQNQHEGGISSPMIAHWPAGLKARPGSITRQPAHLIDFMATFLDVAAATYPKQIADRKMDPLMGKSLLPILQGKQRAPHETLYFHFGTDRALRQGPWKLVSAKRGRWELYNIDHDRTELHDISAQHPARVKAMAAQWFDLAKNTERLKGRNLTPVRNSLSKLNFRRDTSNQLNKK